MHLGLWEHRFRRVGDDLYRCPDCGEERRVESTRTWVILLCLLDPHGGTPRGKEQVDRARDAITGGPLVDTIRRLPDDG